MILRLDRVKFRSPSNASAETGLPSFGEKLKLEREKRKITLEQISVSTKIGTRMLQALEEDKFNQLPGGIFNKGFVRAYSRFVGLDEDQTVADYLQASGDAPPFALKSGRMKTKRAPMKRISAAWMPFPTPRRAPCPGACSPRFYSSSRSRFRSGAIASANARNNPRNRLPP